MTEPEQSDVVFPSDQSLADTVIVGNVLIRQGAALTATGTTVEIRGRLVVEQGASVHGTQELLAVVVHGDLTLDGRISSAGHLVLTSDPTRVPTLAELEQLSGDSSRIEVVDGTGPAPAALRQWRIMGELLAGYVPSGSPALSFSSSASGAPTASGRGRSGRTAWLEAVGNVVVGSDQGAPAVRIYDDGADGGDKFDCGAVGDTGGTGGSLEWLVEGTLFIRNTDFRGGNGGRGGDVTAGPCPGGSVTGGVGGKPGRIHIQVVRFGQIQAAFRMDGVTFTGWNGGNGGDGSVTGLNGNPGASVDAIGGQGADIKAPLLFVNGDVGPGGVTFAVLNGGHGGDARATGGNGVPGVCDLNTGVASPSGDGGAATAQAGKGGSILAPPAGTVPPGTITASSFRGGVGGDATGDGGNGVDGVPCPRRGGKGGTAGDATAEPGAAGQGEVPMKDGTRGVGAATGGTGGRGGDGGNGGHGGDGGDAIGPGGFTITRTGGAGGNGGDAPLEIPDPSGYGGNGGDAGCPRGGPGTNGNPGNGGAGRQPGVNGSPCQ